MSILDAYEFFFYRNYVQQEKFLKDAVPKYSALLTVSVLQLANLLTLFIFFGAVIQQNITISFWYVVMVALVLELVNYLFLIHGGRFELIVAKFSTATDSQQTQRRFWCWVYEVGSFVVFFASVGLCGAAKAHGS